MRKGGNFMKIRKKMAGTIAMIMALSLGYNAGLQKHWMGKK